MNIFIGNLPFALRKGKDLEELFKPYGEVTAARVIINKVNRRSKGYGFVEMEEENGRKAIEMLNGTEVQGRNIIVTEATGKAADKVEKTEEE